MLKTIRKCCSVSGRLASSAGWRSGALRQFSTAGAARAELEKEASNDRADGDDPQNNPYNPDKGYVYGQRKDSFLDLSVTRIGQRVRIPYEITISDYWRDAWMSAFYTHDRVHTSANFCKTKLHMKDVILPHSMMIVLASSMAHIDDTRDVWDLGYRDMVYERPAFTGDTFHKSFTIMNIRETVSGHNTVVDVHCELFNNDDERVVSMIKTMMYSHVIPERSPYQPKRTEKDVSEIEHEHEFRNHVIRHQEYLPSSASLQKLHKGQIILHSLQRPLCMSTSMNLSTLFRHTHPMIYDTSRFDKSGLIVTGSLVLALTHAATARGLYEILCEETTECSFINTIHPNDTLGAISYIEDIKPISHKLEEIRVRTLGIKNTDIPRDLHNVRFPISLFDPELRTKQVEQICRSDIQRLSDKIVCGSSRTILRQSPEDESVFLL